MKDEDLFRRYQELQRYVGWGSPDAERVQAAAGVLTPRFSALVDDFYEEIERHPNARKVITGGAEQIQRLKGTLNVWLTDLVSGRYDLAYVTRRWRVGWRHVEIGLDQVYTNVALSRLRTGLVKALHDLWQGDPLLLRHTVRSLDKLLDLDLAMIEDAYQTEYSNRLQRTERLAAIGQVGAGVAHELRNPLNVVKTSVYFLLNARNPSPQKQVEHLNRIEKHVTLADGVITALSNFAKLPVPNMQPIPLRRVVEEVLEFNPMPGNVTVVWNWPDSLSEVLTDAAQLRIVISNLVRNAREAMPQGGQLTLAASPCGEYVELEITDTGSGISAEHLTRILEPLYTTKARGLGLGLAIVRSILEKNRGRLRVRSEVGKGSTFVVEIPAAHSETHPLP